MVSEHAENDRLEGDETVSNMQLQTLFTTTSLIGTPERWEKLAG